MCVYVLRSKFAKAQVGCSRSDWVGHSSQAPGSSSIQTGNIPTFASSFRQRLHPLQVSTSSRFDLAMP